MKADTETFHPQQLNHPQLNNMHPPSTTTPKETNTGGQDLADSQISMPLHRLPYLLPRFKETIHSLTSWDPAQPSVHLMTPTLGPPLMDLQNPTVQLLIRVHEAADCIIDGRSSVNVISKATSHNDRHYPMGAMSLLATDGRHIVSTPNRPHPKFGIHIGWPFL